MAPLLEGGLAVEVVLQRPERLLVGAFAAYDVRAEVARIVCHARILPVDKVKVIVSVNEEVQVKEIVVGKAHRRSVGVGELLYAAGHVGHLAVARHVDRPFLAQQRLVVAAFLIEVEAVVDAGAGLVDETRHLHRSGHLRIVARIEVAGIGNETRDLPTAGILVDEGVVEPQLVGDFLGCALACAVDHGLGADAGVAVDVLAVVGGEVAGEVRESLL